MNTAKAYEEVADFIATQTKPGALLAFKPSEQTKKRVFELVTKEKEHSLSGEEKSELDHYMYTEHLMRLAKAKAIQQKNNEEN
jgi:hypothetical protein